MAKKRIINILLAVILLFAGFAQNPTEILAAKKEATEIYCTMADDDGETKPVIIESGKEFYVGDYVVVDTTDDLYWSSYWATELEASYVSDHPESISVGEDGYAKTKEPGDAAVTVSYQGMSAQFLVTVVEKGTFSAGKEEMADEWEKAGRKLAKKIPKKLTAENGYTFLKAVKIYLKAYEQYADYICSFGDPQSVENGMLIGWDRETGAELAPICNCFDRAKWMMRRYIEQYHPWHDKKYWFNGDERYRVTATTDQVTVTYKKKLTDKALLALYFGEVMGAMDPDESYVPYRIDMKIDRKRLAAPIALWEGKDKTAHFEGSLVFEKGSRTATVKLTSLVKYVNGKWKHSKKKNIKLKKGASCKMYSSTLYLSVPGVYEDFRVK